MFIIHVHCSLFMFIVHCSHGATLIFDDVFLCVALNAIGFGVPGPDFGVTQSLISPSKASKGMTPVVKLT